MIAICGYSIDRCRDWIRMNNLNLAEFRIISDPHHLYGFQGKIILLGCWQCQRSWKEEREIRELVKILNLEVEEVED